MLLQNLLRNPVPAPSGMRRGFNPVVDGVYLPQHPYFPEATPLASDIPMIICSTMNESSPSRTSPELENITLDKVIENVRTRSGFSGGFGDKAAEVVNAYVKAFPDKKPVEIWSMVSSSRQGVVTLADAKSKQAGTCLCCMVLLAAAIVRQQGKSRTLCRYLLLVL